MTRGVFTKPSAWVVVAMIAASLVGVGTATAQGDARYDLPVPATRVMGLQYADLPGNAGTVDLYLPADQRKPAPVIVWSAGSGFMGDNGNSRGERIAAALSHRGYAVAAVAVRSSSQAIFPAQVNDAKAAVRWLRAHADEYNLDPDRFASMGNSSGGWVASMLATTGNDPALEGAVGLTGPSSAVQAGVSFFAPTDFLQQDAYMLPGGCDIINRMGGGTDCHDDATSPESRLLGAPIQEVPGLAKLADPGSWADAETPPMLLTHGTDDLLLPTHQGQAFFEALSAARAEATFYTVHGFGHDMSFLDQANHHALTDVLTTSGNAKVRTAEPEPVTWDTVADFLDAALNRGTPPGKR
ncbi:alpha/beta hydrolase [Antribacter gilvus]|uniref:alpha/beta hydrolase n=1 Tax=Antribacter gilvus TaxID=2304675 RepID=UPI000F77DA0C|nr:alpha/beta hydrolase [Antribacter gilvus]